MKCYISGHPFYFMAEETKYTEDNIRSLDWKEHIRIRPGMYIGKLGDGSSADDGIYILLKEVLDNSIFHSGIYDFPEKILHFPKSRFLLFQN